MLLLVVAAVISRHRDCYRRRNPLAGHLLLLSVQLLSDLAIISKEKKLDFMFDASLRSLATCEMFKYPCLFLPEPVLLEVGRFWRRGQSIELSRRDNVRLRLVRAAISSISLVQLRCVPVLIDAGPTRFPASAANNNESSFYYYFFFFLPPFFLDFK